MSLPARPELERAGWRTAAPRIHTGDGAYPKTNLRGRQNGEQRHDRDQPERGGHGFGFPASSKQIGAASQKGNRTMGGIAVQAHA